MAAEGVAYREQGFAQGRAFAEHLPGGDHAARGHGVVIAELPAVEAPLFAQLVDEAFHSEIRLVDPEPPERARRKVIREYRLHMHVHGGDVVGAGGMGAGTGDDRAARRGVRAGIRDDTDLGGLQDSLFVAADDVMELHAVALGVHTDGFGPGEPDLASAAWGWQVKSSLPPNAPPESASVTVTLGVGTWSRAAMSVLSCQIPCDWT